MHASLQVHDIRPLSEREAEVYVASTCFKTGPPGSLGLEIERLVYDEADPRLPVSAQRVEDALSAAPNPLPGGGILSIEPGGQPELSSQCAADLPALIRATRSDLSAIDRALVQGGLRPGREALDSTRPPRRSLNLPRYAAMQHYFDRRGPAGRTMMCSTAAIQVCVDAGLEGTGPGSAVERWRRIHRLAPVLIAMFANSPFRDGRPSGWRSGRQAIWLAIDPARTQPPASASDPRAAWATYALDAPLLCMRNKTGSWAAPHGLTMRSWLRGEGPRPATMADLDYHLSTLFPPVRPRGFLEIRVLDTQAGSDWEAAAAIVAALVDDSLASDQADEACLPLQAMTESTAVAAREALTNPTLAAAARACAEAAMAALPRLEADEATQRRAGAFVERYTSRGRCPADDRLASWHRTGLLEPRDLGTSDEEEATR